MAIDGVAKTRCPLQRSCARQKLRARDIFARRMSIVMASDRLLQISEL